MTAAIDQALDSQPKSLDKAPDSNSASTAAAQWQSGDFRAAANAMQLPNTSSDHLPSFNIENSGTGNITFNFNMGDGSAISSGNGTASQGADTSITGLKGLEQDLSKLQMELSAFDKFLGGALSKSPTDSTSPTSTTTPTDSTSPTSTTTPSDSKSPTSTTTPTDSTSPTSTTTPTDSTTPTSTTTPTDSTTPTSTVSGAATGNFSVANGKIIGPDGQQFVAKGLAVYASDAAQQAQAIFAAAPDTNFIRLAANPSSDSPQSVQAAIEAIHAQNPKAVVEVEDHTSPGTDGTTSNVVSGDALTAETNWYAQIASANKDNPYVWFGTANEPSNPDNQQAVVDQESDIYNAIRGTGAQNMTLLEAVGGWDASAMQADPGAYANMTNVAWDVHYYGWKSNGSTSLQDNVNALNQMASTFNGITEAGGQAIPLMVGEYGDAASNGGNNDVNATAAVDAVQTALNNGNISGAVAWAWDNQYSPNASSGNPQDSLTVDGVNLSPYGQEVANFIANGTIGSVGGG